MEFPININFIFHDNNGDVHICTIQCLFNEKVSDVIKRYRKETGDYVITNKFIFNSKEINHIKIKIIIIKRKMKMTLQQT